MRRDIPYANRQQLAAAQRNGNRKYAGLGCTQSIREALEDGAMTYKQLCVAIPEYSGEQIQTSLAQLLGVTGGVVSDGGRPSKYRLYTPAERAANVVAPRFIDPCPPPLDRDLFEFMNLALLIRR